MFRTSRGSTTSATRTRLNGTVQGQPAMYFDVAHGTADRLVSRGDFSARWRTIGARADGVHGFAGGVADYSRALFESDLAAGWNFPQFAELFNYPDARLASIDTVVQVDDGVPRSIEEDRLDVVGRVLALGG